MLRIPQSCIHTRSTPFWNKETAPAGIFSVTSTRAPALAFIPRLSVSQGAVRYLGYADRFTPEPDSELIIKAGHFGVFPPERWHHIEVMTDDTLFNIDFFVEPDVLKSL